MAKLAAGFTYTDAEMLDLVREAIIKVSVHGQSYMIAGRTYTRANLTELENLRQKIEARVNGAASGIATAHARRRRR